ncbi:MAG: hypothetical protein LW636_09185 [Planctomycetaceae bacterium]|jgi:hypothetical protein|nr:hypothetical protein [Planctomycetaceae bacterium]
MPELRIRKPFQCAQCGYDLEGLPVRGNCPECGCEIVTSLARAVDGDAEEDHATPREGAAARARALFFACLSILLSSLAVGPAFIASMTAGGGRLAPPGGIAPPPQIDEILRLTVTVLSAASAAGAALGLATFVVFMPIPTDGRALLVRAAGIAAFALWGMLLFGSPGSAGLSPAWSLPAALALLATAPLFRELGTLSRVYRTRRAARQRVDLMLAAALTAGGAWATAELVQTPELAMAAWLLGSMAAALFVFGAGYLVVNAWWILRAVTRPAPRIREVVGEAGPSKPN